MLNFKNYGSLTRKLQEVFPRNLKHDPQHVLDGMLVLKCFFCKTFRTPIEFDMTLHLLDKHRKELVTKLPLSGKGFSMDYRAGLVIDIMKKITPSEYYDYRTAKFASEDD